MTRARKLVAALFSTAIMAVTVAAPAGAQPVITGGLINITLVDVLNDNQVNVQVPIGVAVNACDINAAILLAAVRDTGSATCEATARSIAWAEQKQR